MTAVAYVRFGDDLHTNVLLNLSGSVWAHAAQGAVVLSNALRAPLFCVLFYVAVASKFPSTLRRVEATCMGRPAVQLACLLLSGAIALGLRSVGGTAGVALSQVLPSLACRVLHAYRLPGLQRGIHRSPSEGTARGGLKEGFNIASLPKACLPARDQQCQSRESR